MEDGRDLANKSISVIGLGVSGFEAARFAKRRGARVFLSELKETRKALDQKRVLESEGIEVEIGAHSFDRIQKSDWIVISPGIKPQNEIYRRLLGEWRGTVMSEIEFGFRYVPCEVIAVTGTNGKTTTTSLIAQMFQLFGVHAVSCGNIGNPFIAEIDRLRPSSKAVIEVSSFQLEQTFEFRPHVALLLNITPDHFDWHGTMENYVAAKAKIFRNQRENNFAVLNAKDPFTAPIAAEIRSKIRYFNQTGVENPNWDAVLQVADIYGFPRERVMKFLRDFPGIKHRMEKIPSRDGICYINDSKSTNPSSLEWALERMNSPVVLICGGRNKGNDFSPLADLIKKKVRTCVLIGEAAKEMREAWRDIVCLDEAANLRDAVEKARGHAGSGGTVLLSPGCASFDMFLNYEDRGDQFRGIVFELAGKETVPAGQ
ncbi:MAG TPA: UDP-N-acetylmuramoyl-L-alanine--D-glutamate ligase [Candidatus Omnitrophota bacterium]|nr:UDP-N-acetylmuramoyl-L-alanine--D-glutamate ligase [Candidatus Omnitrophota bacterium]